MPLAHSQQGRLAPIHTQGHFLRYNFSPEAIPRCRRDTAEMMGRRCCRSLIIQLLLYTWQVLRIPFTCPKAPEGVRMSATGGLERASCARGAFVAGDQGGGGGEEPDEPPPLLEEGALHGHALTLIFTRVLTVPYLLSLIY